jgi:hypothetical protein
MKMKVSILKFVRYASLWVTVLVTVRAFILFALGGGLDVVLVAVLLLLVCGIVWLLTYQWPPIGLGAEAFVIAICFVLTVCTLFTGWPMRITVGLSSSALDRLADQVEAGNAPPAPVRAGLFTIKQTRMKYGANVILQLDEPYGEQLFLRLRRGYVSQQVNLGFAWHLQGDWYYVEED